MFHLNPGHDLRKDQPDVNLSGEMFRSKYRSANWNTHINAGASEHININAGYHFESLRNWGPIKPVPFILTLIMMMHY